MKRSNYTLGFFDIETVLNKKTFSQDAYMVAFISENYKIVWILDHKDLKLCDKSNLNVEIIKTSNPVQSFITFIVTNCANYKIYAHNMSKFDGHFLLDNISSDDLVDLFYTQQPLLIKLKNKIEIKDSLLLLPASLNDLARGFKLDRVKLDVDHTKINLENYFYNLNNLILYCLNDAQIGYDLLKIFQKEVKLYSSVDPLKCISLSQFAYKTYKKDYYLKEFDIVPISKPMHQAISNAYYGGRVDFTKVFTKGPIYCYDVNSMYAHLLKTGLFPTGSGCYVDLNIENISTFFGFLDITIIIENLFLPVLPYRTKENTIFPIGTFRGWFFSEELKFALKLGYKIKKVHTAIEFTPKTNIFTEFATVFTNLKEKNAIHKGPIYEIAKLIPNSLIGKLGQRNYSNISKLITIDEYNHEIKKGNRYADYIDLNLSNNKILQQKKLETNLNLNREPKFLLEKFNLEEEEKKTKYDYSTSYPIHIAAAVTAYARIFLYEHIQLIGVENFIYCDTDSLFLTKPLPDCKVDQIKTGFWKLENIFEEMYVFGAKSYVALHKTKEKNKIAQASIDTNNQTEITDQIIRQYNAGIPLDQIKSFFFQENFFVREKHSWKISYKQTKKVISPTFTKKRDLFLTKKNEYFTKPKIIK